MKLPLIPDSPARCKGYGDALPRDWRLKRIATKCYRCYSAPVARFVTQRELRNDSGAVLREVQAGRTVVVTRNGVPVAELRPFAPRRFVPRAAIAAAAKSAPPIDRRRLRAHLDAVVRQSLDG